MKAAIFATLAVLMLFMVSPAPAFAGRWYLMAPPCAPTRTVLLNDGSKTLEPVTCDPGDKGVGVRSLASLSKWKSFGSFDSVEACDNLEVALIKQTSDAYLEGLQRDGILSATTITLYRAYDQMSYARCVPSNDTIGWYLLVPPRSAFNEKASFLQGFKVLTDAPLSKWGEVAVLELKEACEITRSARLSAEKSVYTKSSERYIQLLEDQAAAKARDDKKWLFDNGPAVKMQRYITETNEAGVRALEAARCIATDDPRLKR
jgi:hypothetical protein